MTAPIRVLELRSVRGTGGGPEKTILLGARHSDPSRFRITVCYIRDARDDKFGIDAWAARLGIDYVEVLERHSFDRAIWPAIRTLVRQRHIDIIHSHDYKTNFLALTLAKAEGITPLATSHGWTGHTRRERWLYYPFDKQLLRWFPMTIAVSGHIRADLIRARVQPRRIRVIHNGIDHLAFRRDGQREAAARHEFGLSDHTPVVGAAGRLEPQKRFDLLIRACALLQQHYPRLRLLIAGEGSCREPLETLGRQLMRPGSLTLLGHQSSVVTLHHALDVFVQSSDYEGTSNALLEAMALQTPIVATVAGGTQEMLAHGSEGLLVPTGDAAALAQAIAQTITAPNETMSRVNKARSRIEHELSFSARMQSLEWLYEEVLGRRQPSAPDPRTRCRMSPFEAQ